MTDEALEAQDAPQPRARPRRTAQYLLLLVGLTGLAVAVVAIAFILKNRAGPAIAPDFAFTLNQGQEELGGPTLNLSDLRGKPAVLNFWAGLCPPCRTEMPDLQLYYEEYRDRVTVVGIDLGQYTDLGSRSDALALIEETGITYPTGFTSDPSVAVAYEILYMPTTLFIDSRGRVFERWEGRLTLSLLTEVTTDLLARESR